MCAELALADQRQELGLATLVNAEGLARPSVAAGRSSLTQEAAELFDTGLSDLRHQELHQHVDGDVLLGSLARDARQEALLPGMPLLIRIPRHELLEKMSEEGRNVAAA